MIIIACVDKQNGMSFYGRRQTKDRVVQGRILQDAYPGKVTMSRHCAAGFPEKCRPHIICRDDPMEVGDGYCMIETEKASSSASRIEKVILYRWDTVYPADVYFDLPLDNGWELESETYFDGYSHPDVRREVYVRKERT